MVVVVKEAKRQVLQLGKQRELVRGLAHTGVVADAVAGLQFCSAIFDGSYRLVFAEFLTYLLFELVCDFTGKSVWPGEREVIAERRRSNLLWIFPAASLYKGPCVALKFLCLPLKTLFQKQCRKANKALCGCLASGFDSLMALW